MILAEPNIEDLLATSWVWLCSPAIHVKGLKSSPDVVAKWHSFETPILYSAFQRCKDAMVYCARAVC